VGVKGNVKDAQDSAKVMGFLGDQEGIEAANMGGGSAVDIEMLLRGKAAAVVDKIMLTWTALAKAKPEKYVKPLAESGFWGPFKSGFGLAASAIMGILTMSENAWDLLVTYIEKIKEGIGIGTKEAMDDEEMTQSKSGSLFSKPATFGAFFKGIIEGSNIEMIIRGFLGDVNSLKEVVKRIVKMVIAAVQALMKKEEEDVAKEVQGQMGDTTAGAAEETMKSMDTEEAAKAAEETTDAITGWTDSFGL